MALFRKKKDQDDVQTAEHDAVAGDTSESGAIAAGALESQEADGDGGAGAEQPTVARDTPDAPAGGSFIPSGGARVESDSAADTADSDDSGEASGQTADSVEETGERAEERREDAAQGAEPEPSATAAESETPHQAQRKGEGLPEPEEIGGRASAIRQSAPASQPAPEPGQAPRESPLGAQQAAEQGSDRPELAVAGAFLGGLAFARLLAWMGDDDDD